MRGGTSKGLFICADDLPASANQRNRVLLAAMGSPDMRQIDGIGGAHPLTSKVAILSKPTRDDADIDYLFLQVSVDKAEVSDAQNCGNMLAGVGPWAIEKGWVKANSKNTSVRIHMVNTGGMAVAHVPTSDGEVVWSGETKISGVPGQAAGIAIDFLDIAGSATGALFPTGSKIDHSHGIETTCIDNGMPVILIRASDIGCTGYELPDELENNAELKSKIEAIRLELGAKMNLGDVRQKTVPKMTLLAPPRKGGLISTRTFIPHRVHQAIGVLGAVSVASGCIIRGTIGADLVDPRDRGIGTTRYSVEHPSGFFDVELAVEEDRITKSALVRTARMLMSGDVFVPNSVWSSK